MTGAFAELCELLHGEITRPAPASAALLAGAIRARHGASLRAVVFYGSCLRRQTDEGVLDFYAIVDDYRSAYGAGALAVANALLPPNVFYLEAEGEAGTRRCKYALLSTRDTERAVAGSWLRPGVWARFAQPVLAVEHRDRESLSWLTRQAAVAVVTFVRTLLPVVQGRAASPPAASEFWPRAFQETYASETRPEALESIRALFDAAPERYERALALALRSIAQTPARSSSRASAIPWALRRRLAKAVYPATLIKTAFTFGDWLPYALWKVQRHSGRPLVASERQRRHPLVFGWPLLVRILRERALR